jgi:protocatechuate 3,4-dioxygenase beta subunit
MSRGPGRRGIVFLGIGVLAAAALLGVWRLTSPGVDPGERSEGAETRPRAKVLGLGTTFMEEEPSGEPSGALEGVVLDGEGRMVDGARVTLGRGRGRSDEGGSGTSPRQAPRGFATTGGGGRFRIDRLVPGEYSASAVMEGWAPGVHASVEVKPHETARVEIRLTRGGLLLGGRILDVGGGTVAGARIIAVGRMVSVGRPPVRFGGTSDGEGRYRMTLARGPYQLRVEAEGYAAGEDNVIVVHPTQKDVRLVPAARLSGRVIERSSRQPVAAAELSLTSAVRTEYKRPREVRSDADGRFEFTGLEPGSFEILARKGGLIGEGTVVALAVAQVRGGVEVEMDQGFTVSGRVRDGRAGPVGDARVDATRDSLFPGTAAWTRSAPDGTYALEGLLPGSYRLHVRERRYGIGRVRANVVAADVTGVDIVVAGAVTVRGRVLGADHRPVEGARIRASFESHVGGLGTMVSGDGAVSAADGTFELARVLAGRLEGMVSHDDHGRTSFGPEMIERGESRTLALVLRKGGSVAGTVRTEDGQPAVGLRVLATTYRSRVTPEPAIDITGPDGRYRLTNLPAGELTVSAQLGSGGSARSPGEQPNEAFLSLEEGQAKTGVDLRVPATQLEIRGVALGPDGKPVAGAIVDASPEMQGGGASRGRARDLRFYSNGDGQFTIDGLGRGFFTLWGSHPGFPGAELKGVMPGATTPVVLRFAPEATISGVVVAPDSRPVPHYTVTVLPGPAAGEVPSQRQRRARPSWDAPMQRVQDPAGAFELRRLSAGSHELAVSTADGSNASVVVALAAGEQKTGVRIQVQSPTRIVGRIVDHATGRPVAGASAGITGAGGFRAETTAQADGTFALEAAAGGSLRLGVGADQTRYVPESREIEIKPQERTFDAGTFRLLPGNLRQQMDIPPGEHGRLDFRYRFEEGRAVLLPLTPESAAYRAGFREGDRIVGVDRNDVRALGSGALSYLLMGRAGTAATITVETPGNGSQRSATLTRNAATQPRRPNN